MLFGLDGVEIGLIIMFLCLFGGILSGFPVAFAIGGAGVIAFGIIAALDSAGLLIHQAIDTGSQAYNDLVASGVRPDSISVFRFPELPRAEVPVFPGGWEMALDRNVSFIVNRMNERVLAGQSIETLLAVLMFVLMGITLERSKIADDLLTTMARVFGPLPGGLAVSIVVVGAFLAASTGIVGATVVTMGLLALPTMLRNGYSPELATGLERHVDGHAGQVGEHPGDGFERPDPAQVGQRGQQRHPPLGPAQARLDLVGGERTGRRQRVRDGGFGIVERAGQPLGLGPEQRRQVGAGPAGPGDQGRDIAAQGGKSGGKFGPHVRVEGARQAGDPAGKTHAVTMRSGGGGVNRARRSGGACARRSGGKHCVRCQPGKDKG